MGGDEPPPQYALAPQVFLPKTESPSGFFTQNRVPLGFFRPNSYSLRFFYLKSAFLGFSPGLYRFTCVFLSLAKLRKGKIFHPRRTSLTMGGRFCMVSRDNY